MRLRGKNLILSMAFDDVTYVPVGLATACALNVQADMVEVASQSLRARDFLPGRYRWSLSSDRIYDADLDAGDSNQTLVLVSRLMEGDRVKVRFAADDISRGDVIYEGYAYITNITINAPVEGYSSASIQLQGTGELTPIF